MEVYEEGLIVVEVVVVPIFLVVITMSSEQQCAEMKEMCGQICVTFRGSGFR